MNISIIGDSFCDTIDNKPYPSWPYLISQHYNAEILTKGQNGWALYHAYKRMINSIDRSDLIIFCVTDSSRLANRYDIGITHADIHNLTPFSELSSKISKKKLDRFRLGVKLYYEAIGSFEAFDVFHRGLLREIDHIIMEKNKKCIFLKCFKHHSFVNYTFKSGPWGNMSLYEDISKKEFDQMTDDQVNNIIGDHGNDDRINHLNEQNNHNMYLFLKNVIDKGDFTAQEIKMNNYFHS